LIRPGLGPDCRSAKASPPKSGGDATSNEERHRLRGVDIWRNPEAAAPVALIFVCPAAVYVGIRLYWR